GGGGDLGDPTRSRYRAPAAIHKAKSQCLVKEGRARPQTALANAVLSEPCGSFECFSKSANRSWKANSKLTLLPAQCRGILSSNLLPPLQSSSGPILALPGVR